jgi:hypothetical protein
MPRSANRRKPNVEIDRELISLKLRVLATEMNRTIRASEREIRHQTSQSGNSAGYTSAICEMQCASANQWAEKAYGICCDVWERTHGMPKTAAFSRHIYSVYIAPIISGRKQATICELRDDALRTGHTSGLRPALEEFQRSMERLASRWKDKLEIEAREVGHTQQQTQLKSSSAGRHPAVGRKASVAVAERRTIIKSNLALSSAQLCKRLDFDRVPPPEPWEGFPGWVKGLHSVAWKKPIRNLISKDRVAILKKTH